jgi:hypothetical protein
LDERARRRWAAAEARSFGWGGVAAVAAATNISERTIRRSIADLDDSNAAASTSPRTKLWRVELQKFAKRTGLVVEVCHLPPGTSKWNKIKRRLFCHITRNRQGVPLETKEIVVNLVGQTKTSTGLEVHVWLDENTDVKGRKVTNAELEEVVITRNRFHGEWNYKIHPA